MTSIRRLRDFVVETTRIIDRDRDEVATLADILPRLDELVAHDDWLPDEYAAPDPQFYRQYLLHADPLERLSIVSFVWGPGQKTPVHDHRVWGLVGLLRGAERSIDYRRTADGKLTADAPRLLEQGSVVAVSPRIGDIHEISNARPDGVSISIHVYGGNIGAVRRATFDPATGVEKAFVSGYSNGATPNLWDRSHELGS
ncbi:cysteine dioxygenase [Methylosinus sporium]|uniref:Cysteine dioxygenase n=1 Tax=Methylosinus sporium TaxID=428 RepID=A0A549SNM1_METSR|nr:cysteine dioxygenase [Methylosinus sporium]TRL31198.1 cysteine dioxygenase [Methylosinus sporium]